MFLGQAGKDALMIMEVFLFYLHPQKLMYIASRLVASLLKEVSTLLDLFHSREC